MDLAWETIYSTLFSVCAAATVAAAQAAGLTMQTDRRMRHWSAVSPNEMPILMMSQREQEAMVSPRGAPTKWTLWADFAIYLRVSNKTVAPASVMNPLVDAFRKSLKPTPPPGGNGMFNLGLSDMVEHAAIEGKIETDEGVLGDLAISIIPVKVFTKPAFA